MASNAIHAETAINMPQPNNNKTNADSNDDDDEDVEKTAHHNITEVLKEIACSPTPKICPAGMKKFKELWYNKSHNTYNRDNYIKDINKSIPGHNYTSEQLEDIVEKLEASRGYSQNDIKKEFLEQIEEHHGYNKSQMTKMLEKLNEIDHYAILHYATIFNNVPFCKIIIEDYGCNVNLVGWDGETPLHIAARLTDIDKPDQVGTSVLAYLLLQPKVNKDIQDSEKRTPLHLAIMYNCYENANYLINNGAKADIPDIQGAIPLHYACRFHRNIKLIHLFLDNPILSFDSTKLLNYETKDKKKPIDIAAEYGNLDVLEYLIQREKFQNKDQKKSTAALITAAVSYRENEVLSFLKRQLNYRLHHRNTLHFACRQLHGHKMISDLINEESIMYQDKKTGSSPLMVAVQHRQLECIKQLLYSSVASKERAIHLVSPVTLRTVFHICAEVNRDEITLELCQPSYLSNLLILAADLQGDTPLHICAKVGNAYMTKKLLDYININNPSSISTEVIPYSTTHRTMTNLDANGRVLSKPTPKEIHTTTRQTSDMSLVKTMLLKKNKNKYTPLHVAIYYGNINVIEEMFSHLKSSKIINACDDQKRTSLHMAAEKGHVEILKILIENGADADACDINDWTPLHNAARCSIHQDDNKERAECIEILVNQGKANINALNIRRETPLHIACEYGSKSLIKRLRKLGADLFATNVEGYNCLEVAIEEGNEEVVQYLLQDDSGFDLMRNAQISDIKSSLPFLPSSRRRADTPMRKLIREMPKMALLMLNKCVMTIGTIGTSVHKNIFVYEFLEDQYTVQDWEEDNFGVHKSKGDHVSTLYTWNKVEVVKNHPLFMMSECDIPELMSHPLSAYLVNQKFNKFGIYMFSLFIFLYITYLILFTTITLRTQDPATYYNQTNFADFDDSLCYNVSQALINGSSGAGGIKTTVDYVLKYFLYVLIWLHVLKNVGIIVQIGQINFTKTLNYWMEIGAVILCFTFVYDQDYQMNLTFRCPLQWQYGALALLLSWLCLLHYVQFLPMIGIYVSMLWVICKKFLKFLFVLIILISGFAFAFHMIFQNFDVFSNPGLSFIKTALMAVGDMTYEDQMYNSNTVAYYKLGYLIYILFAILITILVTNLLIGLAVGDIPPLMQQASQERNRLFFELVGNFEVFRYQMGSILCCRTSNDAMSYSFHDVNDKKSIEHLKNKILKFFAGLASKDDQGEADTEEQLGQQTIMLKKLKKQMQVVVEKTKSSSTKNDDDSD